MSTESMQERAINTIRFLAADAIQKANSGHPGMPMGAASIGYTLWTRHLRFNPADPRWPNRDRFVLSGGHGSMLLYALLYLTGYDIPFQEIINFRQWGSMTPGHPEYGRTPGVEATTGPLGQGIGNAVGMAIAEAHLAAVFNRPDYPVIDHWTYVIATDGDLMEGISSEAGSLAGHLGLNKLIVLYDDNKITIDGSTSLTFTEDVERRFESFRWRVIRVADGNDVDAIDDAIKRAKQESRPTLIICRTHIGYGLPTKQDKSECHGAPPGEEELRAAKMRMGWPIEPTFYIPEDVLTHFRSAVNRGAKLERDWSDLMERYRRQYPELAAELDRRLAGKLPDGWDMNRPTFSSDPKGMSTRVASGRVINVLAQHLPELIGGSADLTESNRTWIDSSKAFQIDCRDGRNIHFGVREHAMAACINGMAIHGGLIPYCGTFLVFSDYMRPAIRLSAMSHYPSIWLFTHDSIGLGEDGPTHQPIEQLATLRAIPNLVVIRPADANEVATAWIAAVSRRDGPTAIILTRQNVPILDRSNLASADGLLRGAYVLADLGDGSPEIILMASGSEVELVLRAGHRLASEGIPARVVSFPSWELFEQQDRTYRESVFPTSVRARLAVEAGVGMGWERWVGVDGDIISIETFGASAPYKVLFEKYGFNVENVLARARQLISR